jgi:hypothetical protein
MGFPARKSRTRAWALPTRLWNHPAFKQLGCDRWRDLAEELRTSSCILVQNLDGPLFCVRLRLTFIRSFFLPQLVAARGLIFLN